MATNRRIAADDLPLIPLCTLAGGVGSGWVGYHDLGVPGAVAGGILGVFAGFLVGYGVAILAEIVLGSRPPAARSGDKAPVERIGVVGALVRVAQFAFIAAVCYELYWLAHFQILAHDYTVGREIRQAIVERRDPRELAAHLAERRWLMALPTARPMRWVLREDYEDAGQSTLQLIDALAQTTFQPDAAPPEPRNRPAPRPTPSPPRQRPQRPQPLRPDLGDFHLVSFSMPVARQGWYQGELDRQKLVEAGTAICDFVESQVQRDLPKTLVLKYLPREFVLPDGSDESSEPSL